MDRRNFIRVVGLGVATAILSSTLSGCSGESSQVDYGWNGPSENESDIRLKLLAYAILAPNPHNKQPWLVKFIDNGRLALFVDQTRLLPETDPIARQIHIGQGCFLENLSIAGSHYGYQVNIKYFPEGEYSNSETVDKPVAHIKLIKNSAVHEDPLYQQLLIRQSNKREYDNSLLTLDQKSQLNNLPLAVNNHLKIIDSVQDKNHLQQMLTEAMRIEGENKQQDLETIKMFCFNDQEIQQYRDGFGLVHAGSLESKKYWWKPFF